MALWTPAEIATSFWLDAADSGTLTIDGSGNVEQWQDKGAGGNHASQTTVSLRPLLQPAAQNGLDVVRFSAHHLATLFAIDSTAAFTVYFAGRLDALTTSQFPVPFCFASNLPEGWLLFATPLTGYQEFSFGSPSSYPRLRFGNKASNANRTFLSVSYDGVAAAATGSYSARHDGSLATISSCSGGFATFANASRIGANGSGTNPMLGDIYEIIVVAGVPALADQQKIEGYLAWKWGLEADLPVGHPYELAAPTVTTGAAEVLSKYIQPYDLNLWLVFSQFIQQYTLNTTVTSKFIQKYGLEILSSYVQRYGPAALIQSIYSQPYSTANLIVRVLRQKYKDAELVVSSHSQMYDIVATILSVYKQKYSLAKLPITSIYSQKWDLNEFNQVLSKFVAPYMLAPEPVTNTPDLELYISNKKIQFADLSLQWGHFSYGGSVKATLINKTDWLQLKEKDLVVVKFDGIDFHLIVVKTPDTESFESGKLDVECRSASCLLDLPYATELTNDDLVTGTASQIVNAIAATEGFSIVWDMPIDPPLTEEDYQVSGSSPLQAIKSLVNRYGGIIQTFPDGSIHAQRKHPYDTDKYAAAPIEKTLYQGVDFVSVSNDLDKKDGYNRYEVSNDNTNEGWKLTTERVTSSHYKVKAFKVPWTSELVRLDTSETTNIRIVQHAPLTMPFTEEITEEIEIFKGAGTLSNPFYGLVKTPDYRDATDLGALTIRENGDVKSTIKGNSIVKITYTTKYWLWDVYDTDIEKVQLLLVKGLLR